MALCLFIGCSYHLSNGRSHGKNQPEQSTSWAGARSQAAMLDPCPPCPTQGAPVLTARGHVVGVDSRTLLLSSPGHRPALARGEAGPGPREGPHAGPVSHSTWRNGLQVARTVHHTHTCALTWAVLRASWEDRGLLRVRGQDSRLTLQWRPLQHPDVPHVRAYTCFRKAASSGRTLHLLCANLLLKGRPPRPPSPARRPSPTDVGAGPVTHEGTLLEEPGAAAILSLSFDLCHPRTYQCVARQILGVCAQVGRWERAAAHLRGIPSPLTSPLPTWQGAAPARTSLHLWPRSPCHPHGL